MTRYLTSDIPGVGGTMKDTAEDFLVAEIPRYAPCGEGEHLFVEIEKRGLTTFEAIRRIGTALKVSDRDMGYAGLKDAKGVTRQTISIPRVDPQRALDLDLPGIRVLSACHHRNKLKPGHLAGNRFRIVVRNVAEEALQPALAVLAVLTERGVPNYFGQQRYGSQGNSHVVGGAILRGDWQAAVDAIMGDPAAVRDERWRAAIEAYRRGEPEESARLFPGHCRTERDIIRRLMERPGAFDRAVNAVHPRLRSLYLSAWQSALFDRLLDRRLSAFDRVMKGDLAWRHDNGACFLVEDEAAESLRAQRLEISPSGPMFGSSMTFPQGEPLVMEEELLREEGLSPETLRQSGMRLQGERRPLRVPLREAAGRMCSDGLQLEFSLPRGAYATSVLREIMKDDVHLLDKQDLRRL